MKPLISLLITLLSCTTAFGYTVNDLPVSTQFRDSTDFNAVCNPDGVLTRQEVDSLNSMLWSLRDHQGVQGLVVAIHESEPDDPYEFAIGVARRYGVGGKKSLGFVILVTTEQRGYQIITGDGMEKYLTDAQCSSIGRRLMVPHFKQGQWGRGLISGVSTIHGICNGEYELQGTNDSEEEDIDWLSTLLIIFSPMALMGGYFYHRHRKKHECPKCGKHDYYMVKRVVTIEQTKPEHYDYYKPNDVRTNLLLDKYSRINSAGRLELTDNYPLYKIKSRPVEINDYGYCPDCGYQHVFTYLSTNKEYYIGTFDGTGMYGWGEILIADTIYCDNEWGGGGYGSGGGGSFHSTFGGGSFSGGGAGGRF